MTEIVRSNFQNHPFHLVSPSPWPLNTSISLFALTSCGALSMHSFSQGHNVFFLALVSLVLSMSFWFRDIISEGTGTLRLIQYIFNFFYLNTAKAIPIEEVKQALSTYNSKLHLNIRGEYSLYKKDKNSLGYYLAGLIPFFFRKGIKKILLKKNFSFRYKSLLNLRGTPEKISEVNTSTSLSVGRSSRSDLQINNLIPYHQYSVLVSLLLSRGWMTVHPKNIHLARIKFRQSYLNKEYIFHIFERSGIFIYCDKNPYRFTQNIKGKLVDEILISTKWLHCFLGIYSTIYEPAHKEKRVPANIYDLITPLVLFHWITGGGYIPDLKRGLIILIEGFNVPDVVKLINVLMVKYRINCRLLFFKNNPVIYIYRLSLVNLIGIVEPIMTSKERSKFAIWKMLDNEIRLSGYTASHIEPTIKNSQNSHKFISSWSLVNNSSTVAPHRTMSTLINESEKD